MIGRLFVCLSVTKCYQISHTQNFFFSITEAVQMSVVKSIFSSPILHVSSDTVGVVSSDTVGIVLPLPCAALLHSHLHKCPAAGRSRRERKKHHII